VEILRQMRRRRYSFRPCDRVVANRAWPPTFAQGRAVRIRRIDGVPATTAAPAKALKIGLDAEAMTFRRFG